MQFDVKELAWQDIESGEYAKILELSTFNNEDLVWYEHFHTGERHCMSVDIFVTKHKTAGIYTNYDFKEESDHNDKRSSGNLPGI